MNIYRVRREILRLASAIAEATWYFIAWRLAFALFASDASAPPYPLVLGLTIVAVFVARYLDLGHPGENSQAWAVGIAAAVTLFIASALSGLGGPLTFLVSLRDFRDPYILLTIGHIVLWWRAINLVSEGFGVDRTGFRFRIGIVAMFWSLIGMALVGQDMTPYVFIYFASSLLVMSLARVEEVSRDVAGIATPFDRNWVTILLAAVLGVMLVGILTTSVLSVETVRVIAAFFAPVWNIITGILIGIIYLIVLLLSPLLEALMAWLQPALSQFTPQSSRGEPTPTPEELLQAAPLLPAFITDALRFLFIIAALAAAFWLIAVWARRRADKLTEPIPELRESVWSLDAFGQDARNLLDRALARLRGNRRSLSAESVRRMYASLQVLAAEHGVPRPLDDTPYEYLPALIDAFPEAEAELRLLTAAYVDAHYHELPTSPADLTRARDAWQGIQRVASATAARQPRPASAS